MSIHDFIDTSRVDVLWLLLSFVTTTAITRAVTRHIRRGSQRNVQSAPSSDKKFIKDITISGIHVHHQVWGILLVHLVGLLFITFRPDGGAATALAVLFGVGAALALDEFAMWLHLDDVYWSEAGRKSISALMTAAAVCAGLLAGGAPLGVGSDSLTMGAAFTTTVVLVNLMLVAVCILKGKLTVAMVGLFFPFVALVGALRLAKPTSAWARRRYRPESPRLRRSKVRFGAAYQRRWQRVHDLIGGAPSPDRQRQPAGRPHQEQRQ